MASAIKALNLKSLSNKLWVKNLRLPYKLDQQFQFVIEFLVSVTQMKSCKYHHKTWELLELLAFGMTDELISPYLKTLGSQDKPTVAGYWNWAKQMNETENLSDNYLYMQQMVFNVLLGIIGFRVSVRRNNFEGL